MKIKTLHTDPLDEVSMSPSSLKDFANTAVAKSAVFGFEAEMLIPELENLTGEEGLRVPDYSKDKPFPTTPEWGDRVLHFFTSGDWPNNRRTVETALEKYETAYVEWLEDNFRLRLEDDLKPLVIKAVGLELKTKNLDEINQSIDNEDASYTIAIEKLREKFYKKNRLAEFAQRKLIKTMKDFFSRYGFGSMIAWPYTKLDNQEPNGKTVDELEYDFVMATGFTTSTSKIYHAVSRQPDLWIFEPDSSIEPNDPEYGGIELISPPMPLSQGLEAMDTVFEWAHSYGVATNETTGFHINLSLPNELMVELDPIKLILFIGDKYILDQFDRANSQFAKNLIDQLTDRVRARARRGMLGGLDGMFWQMKRRMDVVAIDVLAELLPQHDRHVSINIKDKYIEFRSAGGDYIDRYKDIRLTVLRCVRALAIACDPAAEQQEYAKKLYKAFGEYTSTHRDVIKYFVEYASGKRSKSQLKDIIKDIQQNRNTVKESDTSNMPLSISQLKELLELVQEQQETVNDESFDVKPDTVAYKQIERDYQALTAIEYVVKNNIKALKNPELQHGAIFIYDWEYDDAIGAIQIQITNSIAEIKWLGSYNSSGKQLMAKGLEQAKAMGATKVKLTSKWNSGEYYKKQGFAPADSEVNNPLTDVGGEYTKDIKEYSVKSYIKQPPQVEEAASTVDQLLQRYSDMPGDANTWVGNKVKKLDTIIATLRKNAYAPELKIFGDAARQDDTVPDDISIFIDLNKIRLDKAIMRSALNEILELGAKYRGMLLPYILVGTQLWTKNDDSTTWAKASKASVLSQAKQGLPITLFDRSFTTIGYAGVSESSAIKSSVLGWIEEVKKPAQIIIDNQLISEQLVKQYSAIELAAILGGHSVD